MSDMCEQCVDDYNNLISEYNYTCYGSLALTVVVILILVRVDVPFESCTRDAAVHIMPNPMELRIITDRMYTHNHSVLNTTCCIDEGHYYSINGILTVCRN